MPGLVALVGLVATKARAECPVCRVALSWKELRVPLRMWKKSCHLRSGRASPGTAVSVEELLEESIEESISAPADDDDYEDDFMADSILFFSARMQDAFWVGAYGAL